MEGINRKRPEGIIFDLGQTIVDDLAFDARRGYERIEGYLVGERGRRDLYELSLEQMEDLERRKASLLEVPFVSFIRILASRHGLAFRGTWEEIERIPESSESHRRRGRSSVCSRGLPRGGYPPRHHQQLSVLRIRAI